jgi:hypothetical protein
VRKLLLLLALLFLSGAGFSQSPADMEFVPAGSICAGLGYDYNSWNKYWEGTVLKENGNVGTVSKQALFAGFNVGFADRLNVIIMLPYLITNVSQGTLNGQSGFQDISINLKGKYGEWTLGAGTFKLGGNLSFSTPVSGYLIDYAPLNLGSGTTNLSYRQLISYKLEKGIYFDGRATYTYRSNVNDINRGGFYYDEGEAYYSDEVKVPDVFDWTLAVGFSNNRLLTEASFTNYNTLGGSDIRVWEPGFPTNKANFSSVQGRFDYYFAIPKGLNFSARVGYTVAGRNVGQSWYGNLSVNYLFSAWGEKQQEAKPVN